MTKTATAMEATELEILQATRMELWKLVGGATNDAARWSALQALTRINGEIAQHLTPSLDEIDRRLLDIDMLLMARNAGADAGDAVSAGYHEGQIELGTEREIIARFPWTATDAEIIGAAEVWNNTLIF